MVVVLMVVVWMVVVGSYGQEADGAADKGCSTLEGTQPMFRQSPPAKWRSIRADRPPLGIAGVARLAPDRVQWFRRRVVVVLCAGVCVRMCVWVVVVVGVPGNYVPPGGLFA